MTTPSSSARTRGSSLPTPKPTLPTSDPRYGGTLRLRAGAMERNVTMITGNFKTIGLVDCNDCFHLESIGSLVMLVVSFSFGHCLVMSCEMICHYWKTWLCLKLPQFLVHDFEKSAMR